MSEQRKRTSSKEKQGRLAGVQVRAAWEKGHQALRPKGTHWKESKEETGKGGPTPVNIRPATTPKAVSAYTKFFGRLQPEGLRKLTTNWPEGEEACQR